MAKTKGPLAWLGADVASSIRLSDDRYLWVFGDTFVGTFHVRAHTHVYIMIHKEAIREASTGMPKRRETESGDGFVIVCV